MKTGLMWYEPDQKKSLELILIESASYYAQKYGIQPQKCHLNPTQQLPQNTPDTPLMISGLEIITDRAILARNYWLT